MRHHQRGGRTEFDREIAIADRIERIFRDRFEAEFLRNPSAIDRIGRAGERGSAKRQAIDALACIEQAIAVAFEHLRVSEQVMSERHGLRDLHVREPGHYRRSVSIGQLDQSMLQPIDAAHDVIDFAAQPQPRVGRDLIVARAAGVQALAGVADQIGQALLDIQMNVFEFDAPFELIALDLFANLLQAALDVRQIDCADDAALMQHRCVRERALDVCERESAIEADRCRVTQHEIRHRFVESARPCGAFRR